MPLLGRFTVSRGVLPTTQFAYRKVLSLVMMFCARLALYREHWTPIQEDRIVQIDISAVFDRVNPQGIPFQFFPVGILSSVLSVLTQFLSSLFHYIVVANCRSKLVN